VQFREYDLLEQDVAQAVNTEGRCCDNAELNSVSHLNRLKNTDPTKYQDCILSTPEIL
jgi:hypothetical protein